MVKLLFATLLALTLISAMTMPAIASNNTTGVITIFMTPKHVAAAAIGGIGAVLALLWLLRSSEGGANYDD